MSNQRRQRCVRCLSVAPAYLQSATSEPHDSLLLKLRVSANHRLAIFVLCGSASFGGNTKTEIHTEHKTPRQQEPTRTNRTTQAEVMDVATQQQIQDTVEKFLSGGGSAGDICSVAYKYSDNRLLLVISAGVVDKLVALAVYNQQKGEGYRALSALGCLAEVGPVAQDAIARAHSGDIFTWLAGPQDHGHASAKTRLITKLTENHATNTRLLEAARGGGDAAWLANFVCESVHSNDSTMAAIAMDMLFNAQRDNDTKWTIPPEAIAVFASIVNSDRNSADATVAKMQDQAAYVLVKHLHVGEVREALALSPMSATDYLNVLTSETSSMVSKLVAVTRLSQEAAVDEPVAADIVVQGVIPALVDSLTKPHDGSVLVKDLCEQSASLLVALAHRSSGVREEIMKTDEVALLVLLCRSTDASHSTTAFNAIRAFFREESQALAIARTWGIPFLIELLLYDKQHASKQDTPLVKILTTILTSHNHATNEANQRAFVDCDGGIAILVSIFTNGTSSGTNDAADFTREMGSLVPLLLLRLQDDGTKKLDTLEVVLEALEIFSRIRENRNLFQWHRGIKRLVDLLAKTIDDEVKTRCARILTNISCEHEGVSRLIVERGAVTSLVAMVTSSSTKLQTCALRALRNLTNNDENRAKIGSLEFCLRVMMMIPSGKATKQKEAAVAVLGNLACLQANRDQIVVHGGIGELLAFLRDATTPREVETAAAALWTVVDVQRIHRLRHIGGIKVLEKAVERHPQHEFHWTSGLRQRLESCNAPF